MINLVEGPLRRFIEDLTPVLAGISGDIVPGLPASAMPTDVTVEGYNLVTAFIDADQRQTDEELWALIRSFSSRLPTTLAFATPEDVRRARLVTGRRGWLAAPSLLFDTLVQVDRQRRTRYAWLYYERAMDLAHGVCAVDAVPSETELAAVERFRSVLLRAIDRAG
ncbi:MAG TPA: hypothetical protein VFO65_10330, partial [Acidimicrobiales bacterium]|nr:hypothetical protein [Acidimicrobiales bacterium]